MGEVEQRLIQLTEPTPQRVDETIFVRDNFFNSRNAGSERITTSTSPSIVFGHILRVEFVDEIPGLSSYLATADGLYVRGETSTPFNHDSRLEGLLEAFDTYIFDKYQQAYELLSIQTADFGRFVVRKAFDTTLEAA